MSCRVRPIRAVPDFEDGIMLRFTLLALTLVGAASHAANADGQLDPAFGESEGRTAIGYLESFTPELRAVARAPATAQTWLFADDANDPSALYSARLDGNGVPDPGYGSGLNGRVRTALPATLIPQVETLRVTSAALQSDGKALVAGGLISPDGAPGAFPAIVCRLLTTGNLDPGYDGDGCRVFRSQLAPNETCRVTDIAVDSFDLAVLVGNCTGPALGGRPFVARLGADGAFDIEFNGGLGIVFPTPPLPSVVSQRYASVVALPDGRIAVLGDFAMFSNSIADLELGLLQFDNGGGADTSFNGNGFRSFAFDLGGDDHDRARDLVLRPDGRLLALGEARRADQRGVHLLLAQTTSAGAADTTFGPQGKRNDPLDGSGARSRLSALELDDLGRAVIAGSDVKVDRDAHSHFGTEFRFGFNPGVAPQVEAELTISALTATSGTVESPLLANPIAFSVTPGAATRVILPAAVSDTINDDGILPRALRITAAAPVSIVATSGRSFSSDSFLLTPVEHLGQRYRISAWGAGAGVGSSLTIAATQFDTTITITPSVATDVRAAGVPYQISLDPGEIYRLGANLQAGDDLSGTTIVADRPISVVAGHSCAQVPAGVDFCDAAQEQQVPVDRWGTQFVAVPSLNRPAGMMLRVLADSSPTLVWFDDALVATLQAGETFDAVRTSATAITTSEPAFATQLELGCNFDSPGNCLGEPSLLVLEPVSRWSSSVLASVRDPLLEDDFENLIRIVLPLWATDSVTVDSVPLPAANFTPVGDSGFAVAQLGYAPGEYRVQAAAPLSATIVVVESNEGLAHNGAVIVATPSGDDLLVRLDEGGARDTSFGVDGLARIDHTPLSGGNQNGLDRAVRAIPDGTGIVAASAFLSPVSQQDLPVAYRVIGATLFRDGFE
jgi:uncharacterized delta-60 repeat protein